MSFELWRKSPDRPLPSDTVTRDRPSEAGEPGSVALSHFPCPHSLHHSHFQSVPQEFPPQCHRRLVTAGSHQAWPCACSEGFCWLPGQVCGFHQVFKEGPNPKKAGKLLYIVGLLPRPSPPPKKKEEPLETLVAN